MIINLKYGESVPPKKVTQGGSSPSYTYTLAITSPLLRPHKVQPSSGGSSGLSTGSVIVIM
ncbi:Hypothetical predicted protein [Paramuricea clavata]|uniref:Uncharacterized protein n=1 Tax=Paramuricea clavata TaxID=317549 RepID=A0A6S7HZY7_PARCT|nr:Hypothetical predicted protein [Paramuricea clavata]